MRFNYSAGASHLELVVPAVISGTNGLLVRDVDAKIDTGADMSVIPEVIRRSLGLIVRGHVDYRGARGEKWEKAPVFLARIRVAGGDWIDVVVADSAKDYMLLGRDILNNSSVRF